MDSARLSGGCTKKYAVFVVDREGRVTSWDAGAEKLADYRREEIIGQHFSRFYPDEDVREGKPEIELKRAETEGSYEADGWQVRKDGSRFWAHRVMVALCDEKGAVSGFATVARDITKEQRPEEALAQNDWQVRNSLARTEQALHRAEDLLEAVPDPVVVVDRDGLIQQVNRQTEKAFGYERQEMIGKPIEMLVPERFRAAHVGHRKEYHKNPSTRPMGVNMDLFARRKDTTEFPVEVSLSPLATPGGPVVIGTIRDITSRKREEEQCHLRAAALEAAANSIMITDRTGTIAWVNPAFSQLTGYTPQEVVGSQPRLLKSGHHEPEFYAGMWGTVLGGRVWHGEVANRRKDGSTYVEEMTITPVRSGKDEITHFVAIKQDVTARKQTEAALAQRTEELARANVELDKMRREQLELKDQFVSHVSHELRSPLAAIHQFVSILLDGLAGELTPDQKEYLQIAFRNVGQLQAMIDDLLEVLKTDAGKLVVNPESISVAKIIDEQVQAVRAEAEGKQLTITIEVAPALPLVQADPHRLRQILTNLLGNAIKFTPAGGTVLVQASVFATDRSFVCVSIADTGIGIPIAEQEQVFGRLHQLPSDIASSRRGLGLGLYICRELVKRHGGQIWVESDAGHGSTFSFTLPVQTGHEATSGPVEKS